MGATVKGILYDMREGSERFCPWWADGGDCGGCPLGGRGKNCIFSKLADQMEAAIKKEYGNIDKRDNEMQRDREFADFCISHRKEGCDKCPALNEGMSCRAAWEKMGAENSIKPDSGKRKDLQESSKATMQGCEMSIIDKLNRAREYINEGRYAYAFALWEDMVMEFNKVQSIVAKMREAVKTISNCDIGKEEDRITLYRTCEEVLSCRVEPVRNFSRFSNPDDAWSFYKGINHKAYFDTISIWDFIKWLFAIEEVKNNETK